MELQTFLPEAVWPEDEEPLRRDGMVFALTGVGIPEALGRVTELIRTLRPARILNLGIAGAYPNSGLKIGDVVVVDSEVYGDVGFELPDEPGFQAITTVPFGAAYVAPLPLQSDARWTRNGALPAVRGCTVNACTGTDRTGLLRETLYQAAIETMEGAAVAQAGRRADLPVCQVRAISNVAARRDMRPANIAIALASLRRHFAACREEA